MGRSEFLRRDCEDGAKGDALIRGPLRFARHPISYLASQKSMPYSSASFCPSAVETTFSSVISHLLPTRILFTCTSACCWIWEIQLRMESNERRSVTS